MKFTDDQVRASADSMFLRLDLTDLKDYLLVGVLKISVTAAIVLFIALLLFLEPFRFSTWSVMLYIGIVVSAALSLIVVTAIKIYSLRLVPIETRFSLEEVRDVLTRFAKVYGWKQLNNRKNLIILLTRRSNRDDYSNGERVTIIMDSGRVFATSICHPGNGLRIVSLFRRKANLNLLREILSGRRNPDAPVKTVRKKRKRRDENVEAGSP